MPSALSMWSWSRRPVRLGVQHGQSAVDVRHTLACVYKTPLAVPTYLEQWRENTAG